MKHKANIFGSISSYTTKGCFYCKKGTKMVLFVTGLCLNKCFYCPLSYDRKNKDIIFANEQLISKDQEIISVAQEMNALGTGITGGEPLLKINRVIRYIKLLKSQFSSQHHIHLYTSIPVSMNILDLLWRAGLDEIRFHPLYDIFSKNKDNELKLYLNSIKNS